MIRKMMNDEMILKVLNGSARMIAQQEQAAKKDIQQLVSAVKHYMMDRGTDLIHYDNLYVQISFTEATVLSFLIDNGAGRVLDLESYTDEFKADLRKKQRVGLKRLIKDVSDDKGNAVLLPGMVFSKN
jgi:hypothetical protein